MIETLSDPVLREQLRAIAARVRNVVAAGLAEARARSGAERLASLRATQAAVMEIFEREQAGYFHNVPGGAELKRSFACRAGCSFCCHLHVDVTPLEAVAIAAGLDEVQRRAVAETRPRVAGLGLDARRAARILCPLLVDGVCSIYEVRPAACRGLYSLDAAECERVLLTPAGAPLPPIRSPAVPRALAQSVAAGINAALSDAGMQAGQFELSQAIDTFSDADAVTRWLAGEPVLPA